MYAFEDEFQLDPQIIYLNHAAVAPWPKRTVQAIAEFAQENHHFGAAHYPKWLGVQKQLRERLQALINAPSANDIALAKNTSEALSFVAYGLTWAPGDEVVISNDEFPSNRIVWESLAQFGVSVIEADLHGPASPEEAVLAACSPRTRLVSISSLQYASGVRMNLEQLGPVLRKHNILFCVDAIQSIGALAFDVQACQADFVMADGHKWMLGPEGLALFYVRPEVRDQLKLFEYGWHMVNNRGNYDDKSWKPAANATRFECGSPNLLGTYALNASLSLLEEVGIAKVEALVLSRVAILADALRQIPGLTLLSPQAPQPHGGIVTFSIEGIDGSRLHQALMANQVICAYRGGGVRFSPHFYTPDAKLFEAVEKVREIVNSMR